MAKKLHLIDTNILISFYNHGHYEDSLRQLNLNDEILFSSVTFNEFIRGAHDKVSKEIALSLIEVAEDRIVTPTRNHWIECGQISEKILKSGKKTKTSILLLQNDILIGLAARDSQATLVTNDKKDFNKIKPYINVPIIYW